VRLHRGQIVFDATVRDARVAPLPRNVGGARNEVGIDLGWRCTHSSPTPRRRIIAFDASALGVGRDDRQLQRVVERTYALRDRQRIHCLAIDQRDLVFQNGIGQRIRVGEAISGRRGVAAAPLRDAPHAGGCAVRPTTRTRWPRSDSGSLTSARPTHVLSMSVVGAMT
jgi:hypothetical protein